MNKIALAILAAALPLTVVTAMPVSTFLAKSEALMKKGPMAVFSGAR